nr:CMF_HP1_G0048270.mRNA.1.CDS.1 [Saccharomyces cerevisiae]
MTSIKKRCCTSPEDGLQRAKRIGFPVMIKGYPEGGGGSCIRQVEREEDFIAYTTRQLTKFQAPPFSS